MGGERNPLATAIVEADADRLSGPGLAAGLARGPATGGGGGGNISTSRSTAANPASPSRPSTIPPDRTCCSDGARRPAGGRRRPRFFSAKLPHPREPP